MNEALTTHHDDTKQGPPHPYALCVCGHERSDHANAFPTTCRPDCGDKCLRFREAVTEAAR